MKTSGSKVYYDILLERKIETDFKLEEGLETDHNSILNGRIRIYDGEKWYTSNYIGADMDQLILETKGLLEICKPQNYENILKYRESIGKESIQLNEFPLKDYEKLTKGDKIRLLKVLKRELPSLAKIHYHDLYIEKYFVSEGIKRFYNFQSYGIGIGGKVGEKQEGGYGKFYRSFKELEQQYRLLVSFYNEWERQDQTKYLRWEPSYPSLFNNPVSESVINQCLINNHKYCPFSDDGIIKKEKV